METTAQKRVGVVRGGAGIHHNASLKKGSDIIVYIVENLSDKWKPVDIYIDQGDVWHAQGLPIQPAELAQRVDLVWDTTQSGVSLVLEQLGIPRVGVQSFSVLLERDRPLLERYLQEIGLSMPRSIIFPAYQEDIDGPRDSYAERKAKEVFEKFSSPWIVRAYPPDPDMGVHVANTFGELAGAIEDGVAHGGSILVEELIAGRVASFHSFGGFHDEEIYNLPLIKVKDGQPSIDDAFSPKEKEKLNIAIRDLYKHLGATHYLNSNFIVHPSRGPYVTSVSFTPDPTDPHLAYSSDCVGLKPRDIFEHILERALYRE